MIIHFKVSLVSLKYLDCLNLYLTFSKFCNFLRIVLFLLFFYSSRISFLKSTECLESHLKQFIIGILFFKIWKRPYQGSNTDLDTIFLQNFSFWAYWINFYFIEIGLGRSLFAFFLYKNQTKIGKGISIIQRNCLKWDLKNLVWIYFGQDHCLGWSVINL